MKHGSLLFWVIIALSGASAGLVYNRALDSGPPYDSLVYGVVIAVTITAFERGVILGRLRQRIRLLPTLPFFVAAEAAYVVLVLAGNALAGLVVWATGLTHESLLQTVYTSPTVLVFSLATAAVIVTAVRVRDLVGGEILTSLILGRYRRPVEEERIFLFVDLVGSTSYAANNGGLRTQRYLSVLFAAMAEPVQHHRGAIDDYIGDMALITWQLARGVEGARCVSCVFAIIDTIEASADRWLAEFGEVPRLRAALHGGSVVTAEIGVDRHKIAYFGDAVNTTARLEALSRELDAPIVISGDLLTRLPALPDGIRARPLGSHALRGRNVPIDVAALERVRTQLGSTVLDQTDRADELQHEP
jgi:adenylate cyclase